MRREYTINELTEIFGCSRTAIVKKIKPDENNPVIKRYKGVYDVVTSNGNIAILFDDEDLEHEKKLSKGFKNVFNNTGDTTKDSNVIDVEPEKENNNDETFATFTNRYIEQYTTFQKEMYNELRQRDNQILLLTTSEKTKEQEYLKVQSENKVLKLRNRVLTVITSVVATVLLIWITFYATFMTLSNNIQNEDQKKEHATQETLQPPTAHAQTKK